MKRLILILVPLLFTSTSLAADHSSYIKGSTVFWLRNFQEATPAENNNGVESLEGGLSIGYGHFINEKLSLEIEAMNSMDFTVAPPATNRTGEFNVLAFTLSPTYWWTPSWSPEKFKFFGKARIGWIKLSGIDIFKPGSNESSLTTGFGIGATYQLSEKLDGFIDLSGLWHHGDIEDYDIFPLMLGLSYTL